jgi:hypothetical protein
MKLDNNISLRNKLLNTDWGNAFTTWQKEEILRGIDFGVDITKYAFPFIAPLQMKVLCEMLRYNFDISQLDLRQLNIMQLNAIKQGLIDNVDVSIYYNERFAAPEMLFLENCLASNEDVSAFADYRYNKEQMAEIRSGLINGEDISVYADPIYSEQMMQIIRGQLNSQKEMS